MVPNACSSGSGYGELQCARVLVVKEDRREMSCGGATTLVHGLGFIEHSVEGRRGDIDPGRGLGKATDIAILALTVVVVYADETWGGVGTQQCGFNADCSAAAHRVAKCFLCGVPCGD